MTAATGAARLEKTRERAARALDLTHAHAERGPLTWLYREHLAAWLDSAKPMSGRDVLCAVRHLEHVLRVTRTHVEGARWCTCTACVAGRWRKAAQFFAGGIAR